MKPRAVADPDPPHCPKYLKLAKGFERQLKVGVLRVGDRLPSVRQLRDEQQVSVATAVGCYVWLERQGYVRARPKSGFYVSRAPLPDGPAPTLAGCPTGPVPVRLTGFVPVGSTSHRADVVQLGPAVVGSELLPTSRLNRSLRLALSAFPDSAVRYEGTRVSRPDGGFMLWVQLPEPHEGALLQRKAAAVGIDILAGAQFSVTKLYGRCVRIACGHPFEVMRPALQTLAGLLTDKVQRLQAR